MRNLAKPSQTRRSEESKYDPSVIIQGHLEPSQTMKKLDFKLTKFKSYSDNRGKLIVFLKESELKNAKKKFGQIYFVTFSQKGAIRGNHYHKKWHEWFGVIEGRVKVVLEDVRTKKRTSVVLDSKLDKYTRLETRPYIAHAIISLTKKASLLSYADTQWVNGDTHRYDLLKGKTKK